MTEVRCTLCGETMVLRSQFEVDGECPECDADPGSLQVLDAYDDADIRTLRCAECGWTVEAGVDVTWDEDRQQIFTVDDACPMCAEIGLHGEPLEPVEVDRPLRDRPEYTTARAAAAKIRRDSGHDRVPVDVEQIAVGLGLVVRRGRFPHHGLLRDEIIEVPISHEGAERFVIAHEVGHHVLRHQGDRHKIEPEANAFASELLIPRHALQAALRSPSSISSLARRFTASRQAAVYAVRAARLMDRLAS